MRSASEAANNINYYFVYGTTVDEIISGYRYLTGKAPIVPKWALGFWQSRERYKTQNEILSTVTEPSEKRKIPLDNIVMDWQYWKHNEWGSQEFDPSRFPDPEGMIRYTAQKYTMLILWSRCGQSFIKE